MKSTGNEEIPTQPDNAAYEDVNLPQKGTEDLKPSAAVDRTMPSVEVPVSDVGVDEIPIPKEGPARILSSSHVPAPVAAMDEIPSKVTAPDARWPASIWQYSKILSQACYAPHDYAINTSKQSISDKNSTKTNPSEEDTAKAGYAEKGPTENGSSKESSKEECSTTEEQACWKSFHLEWRLQSRWWSITRYRRATWIPNRVAEW